MEESKVLKKIELLLSYSNNCLKAVSQNLDSVFAKNKLKESEEHLHDAQVLLDIFKE